MFSYKGATGKKVNRLWEVRLPGGNVEYAVNLTFAMMLVDLELAR